MTREQKLFEALQKIGICASENQIALCIKYYEMIVEKNKVMNLTAITDFDDFVLKHYIDCLEIYKYVELDSMNIIDVGTGAGFPGIPIKIMFENTRITLLDSLNKRVTFLNEVIDELGLTNVEAVHGRAEEFARMDKYREKYDIAVSRAVSSLNTLSEFCIPFVNVGGVFAAYKGDRGKDELSQAGNAIKVLSDGIVEVNEYILPDSDYNRMIIKIIKQKSTDIKYPRGGGKPIKIPL